MGIFPKRPLPNGNITIHWNFNSMHLTNIHICPWVLIGVKDTKKTFRLRSDGLLNKFQLSDNDPEAYSELKANGLITDIRYQRPLGPPVHIQHLFFNVLF